MGYWIFKGDVTKPIQDGEPWAHPETGTKYGRGDGLLRALHGREDVEISPRPEGVKILGWHVEIVGGKPVQVWDAEALPAPTAAEKKVRLRFDLSALDMKAIRPLRALMVARAPGLPDDPRDVTALQEIETAAAAARASLSGLS